MGLNTPSGGGGAPADAAYITGSSNSELSNETVVSPAGDILTSGSFGTTVSLSPGFDTFTQISADHPALLTVQCATETDGNTDALVILAVDESGGTTTDYDVIFARVNGVQRAGDRADEAVTVLLPAGAQFQVENSSDPNGTNKIRTARATIITP